MLRNAFWVVSLLVLALYVFLVTLGAWSPGEVLPVTIAMVVLAALHLVHAWHEHARAVEAEQDPQMLRARERRGF